MNTEKITVTGTILNPATWHNSHFTMQFDIGGGRLITAGCGSATMGMQVTNFSASIADVQVGTRPVDVPNAFSANLATVACPQVYQELVSGPMGLESAGYLFTENAVVTNGSLGSWWIEAARVQVASVAEPSCALLLALGLCVLAARCQLPTPARNRAPAPEGSARRLR